MTGIRNEAMAIELIKVAKINKNVKNVKGFKYLIDGIKSGELDHLVKLSGNYRQSDTDVTCIFKLGHYRGKLNLGIKSFKIVKCTSTDGHEYYELTE